jgi:hypothetical protein
MKDYWQRRLLRGTNLIRLFSTRQAEFTLSVMLAILQVADLQQNAWAPNLSTSPTRSVHAVAAVKELIYAIKV